MNDADDCDDYASMNLVHEEEGPRQLVVALCRQFYHLGWVTGTGGSISIRRGNRIFMTPSGVQKERLRAADLFVLDRTGSVLAHPRTVPGETRCSSTFSILRAHVARAKKSNYIRPCFHRPECRLDVVRSLCRAEFQSYVDCCSEKYS